MTKQTEYHLSEVHRLRIKALAQGHEDSVQLVTKHGSGKTLVLNVVIPGLTRTILRLNRKLHKTFYAIVKAAEAWLAGFKAFALPKLLLLPAPMVDKSPSELLKVAASKVPAKGAYDWQAQAARVDALPIGTLRSQWEFYALNPGGAK
jgi:hypothetical protein